MDLRRYRFWVHLTFLSGFCGLPFRYTFQVFHYELTVMFFCCSSSDDGTCRIWDARHTQSNPRLYVPKPFDSVGQLILLLAMIVTPFLDKKELTWYNILVSGRSSGQSSNTMPQSHQIFCCAFNANGTVFVTGSSDNLARVYINIQHFFSVTQMHQHILQS